MLHIKNIITYIVDLFKSSIKNKNCAVEYCYSSPDERCKGGNCTYHCVDDARCCGICIFSHGDHFEDDSGDGSDPDSEPEEPDPNLSLELGKKILDNIKLEKN